MKRFLFFRAGLTLAIVLLASSCVKTSPVYSTRGTDIHITVDEQALSATRIKVDFVLDNDEHYYYCDIIKRDSYMIQDDNTRFMQLVLDSVYVDYVTWRYDYLKEGEEYIASFPSHCLWYGNDYWEFSGLSPGTEYCIFAFCVDPDTKRPVGEMSYTYVTTRSVKKSSMTFKFYFDLNVESPRITVEPSNDDEPYFAYYIEQESIQQWYDGDLNKYVNEMVKQYDDISEAMGFDVFSAMCTKKSQNILIQYPRPEKYYAFAFGYDGGITTDVFYDEFEFE